MSSRSESYVNEITLHPNVYATGLSKGLISILERVWVREHTPGDGTFYVISGFANYNGGVRFFQTFKHHIDRGGEIVAVFSGSTNTRLTSKQVVKEMLGCGAKVYVINRIETWEMIANVAPIMFSNMPERKDPCTCGAGLPECPACKRYWRVQRKIRTRE